MYKCVTLLLLAGCCYGPACAQNGNTEPELVPAVPTDILAAIAKSNSQLTVVNIWATWCSPCVEEFPEIVRFSRRFEPSEVSVVFVSLDFEDDVDMARDFLRENEWTTRSYIRTGSANAFVNGFIPEWTGTVPATFVFDTSNEIVWSKEGMTDFNELLEVAFEHFD